jgi:hypothetical protein
MKAHLKSIMIQTRKPRFISETRGVSFSMMENNEKKLYQEHLNFVGKRLEQIKNTYRKTGQLTEQEIALRQSIDIVNQLINENAHRPDSIRLLRKILRERAEVQWVRQRNENSLSG